MFEGAQTEDLDDIRRMMMKFNESQKDDIMKHILYCNQINNVEGAKMKEFLLEIKLLRVKLKNNSEKLEEFMGDFSNYKERTKLQTEKLGE